MKFKLFILSICGFVMAANYSWCQSLNNTNPLATVFKWDLQNSEKGTLMFLDVPFSLNGEQYVTLSVAKAKKSPRTAFIAFILPDIVSSPKGLNVYFTNNFKDKSAFSTPIRIPFTETKNDTYIARFINGYTSAKQNDIFGDFTKYKYVVLVFYSKGNEEKTVIVGLSNFQIQYRSLQ